MENGGEWIPNPADEICRLPGEHFMQLFALITACVCIVRFHCIVTSFIPACA